MDAGSCLHAFPNADKDSDSCGFVTVPDDFCIGADIFRGEGNLEDGTPVVQILEYRTFVLILDGLGVAQTAAGAVLSSGFGGAVLTFAAA